MLAGMNVNIWDQGDAIASLIQTGAPIDVSGLADLAVALEGLYAPLPAGSR